MLRFSACLLGAVGAVAASPVADTQQAPDLVPSPVDLAIDVAPTTDALTITFGVPMNRTRHALAGSGPSFPVVTGQSWLDEVTLRLQVNLEPDRVYALGVSRAGTSGFFTADGTRVAPRPWRFATAGGSVPADTIDAAITRAFSVIRDHYAYRDNLGIDWASLEADGHAELAECRSGAALAVRLAGVLGAAQDPHLTVQWLDAVVPTYERRAVANFDLHALDGLLPERRALGRTSMAARTADDIGYLYVGSFERTNEREFDKLLQELRGMRDCAGIVLDLRANTGGDDLLARRLAAFFVAGEPVYAGRRPRDVESPDGFGPIEELRLRGNLEPDVYRKPVAVLTGPLVMGTTEEFLLMMKQAERAFLVGENSYGSSGATQAFVLLGGLSLHLPTWQMLRPDGSAYEGEGIVPHLHVTTKPEDFRDGDPVLDEALQRLRGKR